MAPRGLSLGLLGTEGQTLKLGLYTLVCTIIIWCGFEVAITYPFFRDFIDVIRPKPEQMARNNFKSYEEAQQLLAASPMAQYVHPFEKLRDMQGPFRRDMQPALPNYKAPGTFTEIEFQLRDFRGEVRSTMKATLDGQGLRYTPSTSTEPPERQLVFLGCSYTFGEFVEDRHTLPSFIQQELPSYKVHNFGYPGHGPGGILRELQLPSDRVKAAPQMPGIAVYVYFVSHLHRLECRGSCYFPYGTDHWILDQPRVVRTSDGHIRTEGTHRDKLKTLFFDDPLEWLISKSHILSYLNFGFPRPQGKEAIELLADTFVEIKREANARLGTERFIVFFFPTRAPTNQAVAEALTSRGIEILNYSDLKMPKYIGGPDHIPYDRHPHPKVYFMLSKWLAEEINKPAPKVN